MTLSEELAELVDRVFGDVTPDYNEMYFNSDEYRDYLKRHGNRNDDDTRCLFSVGFIDRMRSELDRIFDAYIIK